ncbi:gag/pol protein [Cucumis melo var. makuwa]|uniref:Gag/pol protein n=1 Tax=Cucumis melo var. makuwa TaxID=1194695 RepID=A0A5A7T9G9_CUCMM|nr:gag/pol protein [Cucumis melo var. makuwa]
MPVALPSVASLSTQNATSSFVKVSDPLSFQRVRLEPPTFVEALPFVSSSLLPRVPSDGAQPSPSHFLKPRTKPEPTQGISSSQPSHTCFSLAHRCLTHLVFCHFCLIIIQQVPLEFDSPFCLGGFIGLRFKQGFLAISRLLIELRLLAELRLLTDYALKWNLYLTSTVSYGITTRYVSFGITILICVKVKFEVDQRGARRIRKCHMERALVKELPKVPCREKGKEGKAYSNPRRDYWTIVKNILKYLRRRKDYILMYDTKDLIRTGYTDSDFHTDKDFRKSTSGSIFTLNEEAVLWRSVKQTCIAYSTMEAKYLAACEPTKEAMCCTSREPEAINGKSISNASTILSEKLYILVTL